MIVERVKGIEPKNLCRSPPDDARPGIGANEGSIIFLQSLERVKGIEPSYSAWKAAALPLSYTRAKSTHISELRAP